MALLAAYDQLCAGRVALLADIKEEFKRQFYVAIKDGVSCGIVLMAYF
jgi:hypothetical protein